MAISVIDGFQVTAAAPIDFRVNVPDIAARDIIKSSYRYVGMPVYVVSENKSYRLVGGTANSNWQPESSSYALTASYITTGGGGLIDSASYATSASHADVVDYVSLPTNNIFIGKTETPRVGTNAGTVIIGDNAGLIEADSSIVGSVIIGREAHSGSTGPTPVDVVIGGFAGSRATNNANAIFIGRNAGLSAQNNIFSITLGYFAGSAMSSSRESIVIGYNSGLSVKRSEDIILIGSYAGYFAQDCNNSSFIGYYTGQNATGSTNTLIFGNKSTAFYANNSIAIGNNLTASVSNTTWLGGPNIVRTYIAGEVSASKFKAPIFEGTASWAQSSSYSISASYASGAYAAQTASYLMGMENINFDSASYAKSASHAEVVDYVQFPQTNVFIGKNETARLGISGSAVVIGDNAGLVDADGNVFNSVIIGLHAYSASSGLLSNNNVIIGTNASANSDGNTNSNFIGYQAGNASVNVDNSNVFGYLAGDTSSGTTNSNFIGVNAGRYSSNNDNSNFIGLNAGQSNKNNSNSNMIGNGAGASSENSSNSIMIGYSAGSVAKHCPESTFIGDQVGSNATGSTAAIVIGKYSTIEYSDNVIVIGRNLLIKNLPNTTWLGGSNIVRTYIAGEVSASRFKAPIFEGTASWAQSSSYSISASYASGAYAAQTASYLMGMENIDFESASYAKSASHAEVVDYVSFPNTNVFIGKTETARNSINNNSIAIGQNAGLVQPSSSLADGIYIGTDAYSGSIGVPVSLAIGRFAGSMVNDSQYSIFIGEYAGASSTGNRLATMIGLYAGLNLENCDYAIGLGYYSLNAAINSEYITAVGSYAGRYTNSSSYAIMIGSNAGYTAGYCDQGIFIGNRAGYLATGSAETIILGNYSRAQYASASIVIGNNLTANADNTTWLGGANIVKTYIAGEVSASVVSSSLLVVNEISASAIYTTDLTAMDITELSGIKYKKNIVPLGSQIDKIQRLNPVSYDYIVNNKNSVGLIAEDLREVYPEFIGVNNESIAYGRMTSVLIKCIQELSDKVTNLETVIGTTKSKSKKSSRKIKTTSRKNRNSKK